MQKGHIALVPKQAKPFGVFFLSKAFFFFQAALNVTKIIKTINQTPVKFSLLFIYGYFPRPWLTLVSDDLAYGNIREFRISGNQGLWKQPQLGFRNTPVLVHA